MKRTYGIDTGQASHVQAIVAYDGYWPIQSCPINYGPRWILVKQIMSTQIWYGIYIFTYIDRWHMLHNGMFFADIARDPAIWSRLEVATRTGFLYGK